MKVEWIPQPRNTLFFVSSGGCHHVRFSAEEVTVSVDRRTGDTEVRLLLRPDQAPLTEAENLAVAILRKDEVAALAAADDVLERFNRPDGFKTREQLLAMIAGLKDEVAILDKEANGLRRLADHRMGVIDELNEELAEAKYDRLSRE